MKETWHSFGHKDQVSIDDVLQAGVKSTILELFGKLWLPRRAEESIFNNSAPSKERQAHIKLDCTLTDSFLLGKYLLNT